MTAAICAYNRPTDHYRMEQFAILLCNAWELLLKARILQLNKNKLASIAVYEQKSLSDGTKGQKRYRKKSRSGNTMTIGLFSAFDRLVNNNAEPIPPVVRANLEAIVEVRDTAVHFIHASSDMLFEAHEVFAAAVGNYLLLLRQWFGMSYDHLGPTFIPISFAGYDLEITAKGSERRLIAFLQMGKKSEVATTSTDFQFGIQVVIEAKKSTSEAAAHYRLTKDANAQTLKLEEEDIRKRFPWTYQQVIARCKDRYSKFLQNKQFNDAMREIKEDANLHHRRLLDREKPDGPGKDFYSTNVFKILDQHWTRKQPELAA